MAKRLLLLDDEVTELVRLALETWGTVYAGERGEIVERQRVDRFHVTRQLEGKYTAAEVEEIAAAALALLE